MIECVKVWKTTSGFDSKTYYHDPRLPLEGIESYKIRDSKDKEVECTKIFYSSAKFVTVLGTPMEFMQKCKDANVAICLLADLYAAGFTIKQFIEETERRNNVTLS